MNVPRLFLTVGLFSATLTAHAQSRIQDWATQVFQLTNQFRVSQGVAPLTRNVFLDAAAQAHSADMAQADVMSHTGTDGSNPGQRIRRTGYVWITWGENVAAGWPSPQSVVNAWVHSPGHRANLLNPRFREIGIGFVFKPAGRFHYWWTQDFATGRSPKGLPPPIGNEDVPLGGQEPPYPVF